MVDDRQTTTMTMMMMKIDDKQTMLMLMLKIKIDERKRERL